MCPRADPVSEGLDETQIVHLSAADTAYSAVQPFMPSVSYIRRIYERFYTRWEKVFNALKRN
jgi:hypothetical protein